MNISAQDINKQIEDSSRNKTVLINLCTREGLIAFPEFEEGYEIEYPAYLPDSLTLGSLTPLINDHNITVVLGTWCGDSKLHVSHFFKVLDALGVPAKNITLICVDGNKKAENGLIDSLKIERVPTFILHQKDKEIGRIIESPKISLEKDLLHILVKP